MKSQGLGHRLNRLLSMLICISFLLQMQPATARATPGAGAASPGAAELTPPSPASPLGPGWQLLSLPERPDDPAAAAVLASLGGSYTRAYAYNACDSADPWKLYDPAAPAAANDLATIDHTIGFWVEMTAADSLELAGSPQPSTEVALCPGWNLVGYPLAQARPVAAALASIAGTYSLVFAYDPADPGDPWESYAVGAPSWSSDLQQLTPGRGYWIYATAATTLTFTAPTPPPAGRDITLPYLRMFVEPPIVDIGQTATITLVAEDNVAITGLGLTVNGAAVPVGANGTATYTPQAAGSFVLAGTASDAAGNTASATDLLRARAAVDNGPPTVALTAPADASLIEAIVDLVGTAADADLAFYQLQASPLEADSFATFATGDAAVSDGVLGRLDPRMFRPGPYLLRVCAEDSWGNRACAEPLQYDMAQGLAHPGIVRLAFQDGFVDTVGLPLSIRRVYDSRDKSMGDFGVGWRLEVDDIKLSTTRAMGEDWSIVREGIHFPTFKLVPARAHRVIVTTPDGRVHRFELSVEPHAQAIDPIQYVTGVFYDPLPGTTSTLTASGNPPAFVSPVRDFDGPVQILNPDQSLYDPNGYVLTLPDGRALSFARIDAGRTFRLTSMRDLAGNVVTIGPDGISHSSGASIGITRDSAGRITKITNPDGGERSYSYDSAGDLTATSDYEAAITRYRYDDNHNLIQMIDPRGYTPGTMVYDESGRLVAVIDANGERVELAHNDSTNQEIITDRLGYTTVTTYDDEGNVTAILDAYSKETRFSYDENGHLASRTNPLGETELFSYDPAGNLLTYTNPLSKTWQKAYDTGGRLTTEIDPLGRTTRYEYDSNGNQTAYIAPSGARTEFRYSPAGALIGYTDPFSGTASFSVDDTGNITGYTDPLGRSGTLTRRADGQITRDQFTVDGRVTAYDYRYNQNGSLTGVTLPDGNTAAMSYDTAGRTTGSTDVAGNTKAVTYDDLGLVSAFRDSDSNVTNIEYDAEGQVIAVLQPNGDRIERTLDRLGRLTRAVMPNGQVIEMTYDDAGRPTREERSTVAAAMMTLDGEPPASTVSSVEYDAAGRTIRSTDIDGTTHYAWDDANQLTAIVNPLNERTEFVYDRDGNLLRTIFPDGNSVETQIDGLGRPAAAIDERGARLEYNYDRASQLASVKDTANGLTSYTYTDQGKVKVVTTPGGGEWHFGYDRLGNQTSQTFPWGGSETYTRDTLGRITAIIDPTGVSTQFAYDQKGRLTRRVLGPGHTEQLTYNASGLIATTSGPHGTTSYEYIAGGRLVRVDHPDGSFVEYEYDVGRQMATIRTASGETSYGYDDKGRLVSVTDSALGSAAYSYDAAGRLTSAALPDGSTTTYTYNNRGWITALRTVAADGTTVLRDEQISYDEAGNPLTRTELGRQVTYSYDIAGRIDSEQRSGADAGSADYAYDPDWNLVQNGARALSYDGTMRLTSDGRWTSYSYDAAGRPLTRSDGTVSEQFSYDAFGRLVRVERSGALPAQVDFRYDEMGLLTYINADGAGRRLIWETTQEVPQLLEERRDDGTLIRRYVRGIGPIGLQDAAGSYTLHQDTLGSVRMLTGADGALLDSYAFSAYGEQTLGTSDASSLRFGGEYFVPELGMYYLRSRFYDPGAGRFLTPDMLAPDAKLPQTYNPYLYVSANPLRFKDPLGTFSIGSVSIGLSIASILVSIAATAYPQPFVMVARAFGFPEYLLPQVGTSLTFSVTYSWTAVSASISPQVDLLWGRSQWRANLSIGIGVEFSVPFGNHNPRTPLGVSWSYAVGAIFGPPVDRPGENKFSLQLQVGGTIAKVLVESLKRGPGGGKKISPEWSRSNVAVQVEIGGWDGSWGSDYGKGYTLYGGGGSILDGHKVRLTNAKQRTEGFSYGVGASISINIPVLSVAFTPNTKSFDLSGFWQGF